MPRKRADPQRAMAASIVNKAKKSRKAIPLAVKLEVLRRFDAGENLSQVSKALGLATSTVSTIRVNRERIKASAQASTPASACKLFLHRSDVMENMERMLSQWILEQNRNNEPASTAAIQLKARSLYHDLQNKQGENADRKPFAASKGWFDRFKRRHSFHDMKSGDVGGNAAAETEVDPKYQEELKNVIEEGSYTAQQVFYVFETGLFWKRMPTKTFISKEEKSAVGFKVSKERLTLLLGGNAAGDFKIKPLLVYQSENPRALKGYAKPNLPVIWRSNKKAVMTVDIFEDWFANFFCPAVEKYCAKQNITNKALLVVDNAPSHPVNLNDLSDNVRVEYLPREATAAMDRDVVANFRAFYLRRNFQQLVNAVDGEDKVAVREYWNKFNILGAVDNVAESWEEVKQGTVNAAWKGLWPDCVRQFITFPLGEGIEKVQQDIVTLANGAGFENIVQGDVVEWLDSHNEDLSNEDLRMLEQERVAGEEEENSVAPPAPRQLTTVHMAKAFALLEEGLQILAENDPNRERSLKVSIGVNDTISCYRELYKEKMRRTKQALEAHGPSRSQQHLSAEPKEDDSQGEADDGLLLTDYCVVLY